MRKDEYEKYVEDYINHLKKEERSEATITQYRREVVRFIEYLGGGVLCEEAAAAYKEKLINEYRAVSVNAKLSAINGFFSFIGRGELRLKFLRIQRRVYCSADRELTRDDYFRLVKAADRSGNDMTALLLRTICSTGIRVSEVRYITAEAVEKGEAVVRLKGKVRTVLIPGKLQKTLKRYMRARDIQKGPVFVTKSGKPVDRSSIWRMMKSLCGDAGVDEKKVFPHNLRHLFARCFYEIEKDISKLADILGHSSIDTTRIYIISSGREHRRQLDSMGLVV